jgi:hypothetical protein
LETDEKIKGIVGEIGLERNEGKFNSFSLTLSLTLKPRGLTFSQGEKRIVEMRKELLGKEVTIAEIIHLCPICERGFNTMQGMRQHVRMVHEKGKKKEVVQEKKSKRSSRKRRKRKNVNRKKT